MSFLEDMRQGSEEERLAFAMIAAGIVALVLFLIWGATLFTNNGSVGKVSSSSSEQTAGAADSLKSLGTEVSGAIDVYTNQYAEMKNTLNASGTTQGSNAVDLSVDENGDVHVDNIIIQKGELGAQ